MAILVTPTARVAVRFNPGLPLMMARKNRFGRRGMTLVEVSIIVVMIGILSALAVVGYARYQRRSRLSEATNLITGIKSEQEAYKQERGLYWQASSTQTSYYPAASPGAFLTTWGGPCTGCVTPDAWTKLHVHPDRPVMYGYATIAGVGAEIVTAHSSSSSSSTGGPPSMGPGYSADDDSTPNASPCAAIGPTDPYYVIQAQGDTNGDGVSATVLSLSCSNTLLITNESE